MNIKDFLENFTGDNHIKIYDQHDFDTQIQRQTQCHQIIRSLRCPRMENR